MYPQNPNLEFLPLADLTILNNIFYSDKDSKPMRVPVGSQIVSTDENGFLFNQAGEPVLDKQGRQMQILPDLCKVILGPEDTPVTDKNGK